MTRLSEARKRYASTLFALAEDLVEQDEIEAQLKAMKEAREFQLAGIRIVKNALMPPNRIALFRNGELVGVLDTDTGEGIVVDRCA